ncbi:MAG: flagellar motor switch protein FliN [Planctomycetes bacterium]|nr:flagellar motor switch protein FliN [Planctomycetota bacterium]
MSNDPAMDAGTSVEVAPVAFQEIARKPTSGAPLEIQSLLDIPVTLAVELGKVRLPLERVTRLATGSVIELNRLSTEPVDILVNGTPVARAEVVTVGEKYGVRIVELVSPEERLKRMARQA